MNNHTFLFVIGNVKRVFIKKKPTKQEMQHNDQSYFFKLATKNEAKKKEKKKNKNNQYNY